MKIDEKLDRLAKWRGLKQIEITDRLGGDVSKATVNNWFKGKHIPDLRVGLKLCRMLGITVEQLADDSIEITEADMVKDHDARMDRNLKALHEMARLIGWEEIHRRAILAGPKVDVPTQVSSPS